jgi:acyl transferase domain-containing protein/NAD(P)H-dependent flavin oxidoreductase YrpB (nitropropane dioxygenase family)/NAD(P)-dependent dehydrogenase (short-subunit alcohol dehydrogenase family)/acyl carrier protein
LALPEAVDALRTLALTTRGRWGVRYRGDEPRIGNLLVSGLGDLLADAPDVPAAGKGPRATVLLTATDASLLAENLAAWRGTGAWVLAEVASREEALTAVRSGVDGVVARGNEAGGRVAEESSFVLLQKLLADVDVPVLAHGGMGRHSAAAACALGAAGAVLDAQLLLTAESPIPAGARAALARLDGSETTCLGAGRGSRYRVLSRPGRRVADELDRAAPLLNGTVRRSWESQVDRRTGWDVAAGDLLPVGQDAALAAPLAAAHHTTGRVVRAVQASVAEHLRTAARSAPLAEGAPLARSHGTRYPLVQGPMTRVSDQPAFARAVADAGALPFLALALLRAPEVDDLLSRTAAALVDRPWGVGVLGFVPEELRAEQLGVIRRHRPPFALVAGGGPDHVRELEGAGIPTYLHVPSPGLLRLFAGAGARRFVFEGRECGGHVGPRSSFVLWDSMVEELTGTLGGEELQKCHVLFAGGIHDSRSAAAVAAVAAPLVRAGARVGALMGTAYLFTEEIVASGAVTRLFQQEALVCDSTALLESGPGYATRCARTAVVDAFFEEKTTLRDRDTPGSAVIERLEQFNLGRLRIATKGLAHGAGGPAPVNAGRQRSDGLFMMGEVAALHSAVQPVQRLHEEVCAGSTARLRELVAGTPALDAATRPAPPPLDLAIVGMSCLLPGAQDLEQYWANILARSDTVREVPAERWDAARHFDSDPAARDKTYSRWGGFLDALRFDPLEYGMPPNSLPHVESMQLLALHAVRAAIRDAGYEEADLPRDTTCVVLGAGGGVGDLGQKYAVRSALPELLGAVPAGVLAQLPEWSEDSFPGILLNVTAGRVANRFDLGGLNCTVDAACASSLAALHLGALELRAGTSDVAVVGGIDTVQNLFGYLAFAKTGALSPTGRCRPFDVSADGIAISEGVAVVVVKRLADARRDGDRVYAVVKSVGGSSDGRARGLTAPRPEGQARALERAYASAGVSPASVQLVEAHGTGTVTGDRVEVETLRAVYEAAGAQPASCAIGSVKSMIGHTKSAAGLAALVKLAKALHHKVLPPTIGVSSPNPALRSADCAFYVNTETRPWLADHGPRRAALSAFGFGGTNFHAVLEEYTEPAHGDARAGAVRWPAELLAWSGSPDAVRARVGDLLAELEHPIDLTALAAATRAAVGPRDGGGRLVVLVRSQEELRTVLAAARDVLDQEEFTGPAVWWSAAPVPGGTAFLYPGQGSQRPGMLADLAVHFPEVRRAFERAEETLAGELPVRLGDTVYPPPAFTPQERAGHRDALRATRVAQPALGAAAVGVTRLLAAFGIRPAMVAGHSYGEYPALWAAGVLDEVTLFRLSERRGRYIAEDSADAGSMLAVNAAADEVTDLLGEVPEVWPSNRNAPRQTVVSGTRDGLARAAAVLDARGVEHRELTVAAAFHSPLVAPARDAFGAVLASVPFRPPELPVFANSTGQQYPSAPDDVAAMLDQHLVSPVLFSDSVEAMYAAGARTFVEAGPGGVLTGLVDQILDHRPHAAIPVDGAPGGLAGLLVALARLWTGGAPVTFDRLAEDRVAERRQVADVLAAARAARSPSAWLVDGAGARPASTTGGIRIGSADAGAASPARSAEQPSGSHTAAAPGVAATPLAPVPAASGWASGATAAVPAGSGSSRTAAMYADRSRPLSVVDPDGLSTVPALPGGTGGTDGTDRAAAVVGAFQQLMDRFLTTNRDVMLGYLQGAAPLSAGAVPPLAPDAAAAPAEPDPVPAAPDPAVEVRSPVAVLQELRSLLVARTGYPVEMLDPELDLEADLGIDSIKRVEVIGAFQQSLGPADQDRVAGALQQLRQMRTLGAMAELLERALDDTAPPLPAAPSVPSAEPDWTVAAPSESIAVPLASAPVPDAPSAVLRQRLDLRALEVVSGDTGLPPGGVFVVTDDGRGVAPAIIERLERRGARAVLLRLPGWTVDGAPDAGALLEEVRVGSGPLCGLIHLSPLSASPAPSADRVLREVSTLARLAREVAPDLVAETVGGRLLVATAGDRPGGAVEGPMVAAGIAGLATTAAAEWPSVRVRVVDLADIEDPVATADALLAELLDGAPVVEVVRSGGRRWTTVARSAPLARSGAGVALDDESVVLLTGGARGITAALAQGLAAQGSPTLILAGRTAAPDGVAEDPATRGVTDPAALRRTLVDLLRGSGSNPSLEFVERRAVQLERDREVRGTLEALRSLGARVEYHRMDVTQRDEVRRLVDDVYAQHGRIDAVVHGAGIVEDRLLVDKDPRSVERVVSTKVGGALHLVEALRPESLRLLVMLTSVAGWFGNPGQADYAAANRALDALARRLDDDWPGRVVAMSWGPWDGGTGMVTGEVRRGFLSRGIVPLPPECAVSAFVDEIRHGRKGEHHVLLGSGPWSPRDADPAEVPRPEDGSPGWPDAGAGRTVAEPAPAPSPAPALGRSES